LQLLFLATVTIDTIVGNKLANRVNGQDENLPIKKTNCLNNQRI